MSIQFPGGTDDYVDSGYAMSAAEQSAGTIVLDFWADASTNLRTLARQGTSGTSRFRLSTQNYSGTAYEFYRERNTTDMTFAALLTNFAAYATGKWMTMIVGWDTSLTSADQYIAIGDPVTPAAEPSAYATRAVGTGTAPQITGSNFRLGHDPAVASRGWNGRIGRYWQLNSYLSLAAAGGLQWQRTPPANCVVAYELYDPGILNDLSGHVRNGTINGTGYSTAGHSPYRRRQRTGWLGAFKTSAALHSPFQYAYRGANT